MRIWTSLPLPDRLRKIVQRHRKGVLATLRKCKRETGCQHASYLWMEIFKKNKVAGAIVEGTFDDSDDADFDLVGHTWLELYVENATVIFDATVDQFHTTPREYKYTEHQSADFDELV